MSLFIAGQSVSSVTTRSIGDDGAEIWTANNVVTAICIAANSSHVVTGGQVTSGKTTRKYDIQTGAEITTGWPVNHGATVRGIAIDDSGNIYTGGDQISGVTTRKYNSAGTLQWSVDHGGTVNAIAVDASGNVYTTGDFVTDSTTRKYNSSGTLQWSINHNATCYGIFVDPSGNIYTCGVPTGFTAASWRRYDSSGSQTLQKNHGGNTRAIIADSSGNIYIGGINSVDTGYYSVRKYNSSGTLQWSKNIGTSYAWALALDSSESYLYVGTNNPSSAPYKNVFKLNVSDGSEITTGWPFAHGEGSAIVDALAWRYVAPPVVADGIPIPLAIGLPSAFGGHIAPGLPFPLSFGLPAASTPPLSPALAGLPVARVYRVWLSGVGSDPLELPISALQCTRRRGDSTWLALTMPIHSVGCWAAIQARMGGEIVVNSGYRSAGGSEVLGLFLRATLTDATREYTRDGAAIMLTARVTPAAATAQSRTLYGIRRQQQDADGRYSVVCDFDPLLRPGDTVSAGAVSFEVLTTRYRISPQGGEMTVTESY